MQNQQTKELRSYILNVGNALIFVGGVIVAVAVPGVGGIIAGVAISSVGFIGSL